MFNDLREVLREFFKKLVTSRLFALTMAFGLLFAILVVRLFQLQIVEGQSYLDEYMVLTKKDLKTNSTRGNIYDRNGYVLASNELAYNVTVQDIGALGDNNDWNLMLKEMVEILKKHGESVQGSFEIGLDFDGNVVFTSASEAARKRFLRDYYGLTSVDLLTDRDGDYPADITARELLDHAMKSYKLDEVKDEDGNPVEITDQMAIDIINIRYAMRFIAYQKYEKTTVATQVSDETVADILEHSADLPGVGVEESNVRVYNDSIYFSHIVGYTGKITEERMEELNGTGGDYTLNDTVGRTGVEYSMETELQGKKGSMTAYVDNMGRILETSDVVEPTAGNDVYLTIDRDLQVGIYHLLERQLAGILVSKIVDREVDPSEFAKASQILIPINDVYFQLINNNVLSMDDFASPEASDTERGIHNKFTAAQSDILGQIRGELESSRSTAMKDLTPEMASYMQYIYSYLSGSDVGIIISSAIDRDSAEYAAWTAGELSLRDFLYYGIANSWIDTTKLNIESRYSDADDVFGALTDYLFEKLPENRAFSKKIYENLINGGVITGKELCLALYDQNILAYDENEVRLLRDNGPAYAFNFMVNKISNVEITPAQLALDPCMASCVVTDVNTGQVLALVSYPGYDTNRISDPEYLSRLNADLSYPLRNNATQTKKAPGSTFKPITAIAALEEGVVGLDELITCTGQYEEVALPIKCWIYPGHHGPLNVVGGLGNSCNYFMSEVAHRMSTDEQGNYVPSKGLETIGKYAAMFGLDHTSGIEISESEPEITKDDPERSSIGQGTNSFTNVQLSRYIAAVANRGTVFELSLISQVTDSRGGLVKGYTPRVSSRLDFADSTWNAVQEGMRQVIATGSAKNIFDGLEVDVAGKTGTAEEVKTRGNHAFFVSFAPYQNPEIAVTVNIPYGYSSGNAATVAKSVYRFYYGYTTLDDIISQGALSASNDLIQD